MDGTDAETLTQPPLQALLQVQAKDIELEQIAYRRRELAERKAVAALEAQRQDVEQLKAVAGAERADLEDRRSEIDAHVDSLVQRIAQIDERLASAAAGSYRDQQAMGAERESLSQQQVATEDDELEVMELLEPIEVRMAVLDVELAKLAEQTAVARDALATADAELQAAAAHTRAARVELAAGLPADLAATYERLRLKLDGVGAAKLVGGACSGCHLTLPSRERDQVLHAPPGQVFYCEQCGRILVP